MVGIAEQAKQTEAFDPFDFIPGFAKKVSGISTGWLILPWLAAGLVVLAGTVFEGTLGTFTDLRWFTDLQYVFGRYVPETPPHVPLIRDAPDIALFLLMAAGALLLHRQWKSIRDCIPRLRDADTIVPCCQPRLNRLTRLLGLNRLIGKNEDYRAFTRLEGTLRGVGPGLKVFLAAFVLVGGLVLAVLLRGALDENVLRVFVPTDASPLEQQRWLAEARNNWWAGPTHPIGYVLYGLLTWFGMSLIVAYNVMGIITVYVAIAVYLVTNPDADWYNKDGRYGWLPMTEVYRTVYWTIVLFGAVMSILVALLGSKTPIAVIGLACLYMLLIPVYTLVPWLFFRKVEKQARDSRQEALGKALEGVDRTDVEKTQAFVAEFARCRDARIRPMSIGRLSFTGFASVVLLPIGLTLLQIFVPFGIGR
jgi:hypothetical protein